jgi:hypothetical protein
MFSRQGKQERLDQYRQLLSEGEFTAAELAAQLGVPRWPSCRANFETSAS